MVGWAVDVRDNVRMAPSQNLDGGGGGGSVPSGVQILLSHIQLLGGTFVGDLSEVSFGHSGAGQTRDRHGACRTVGF